MISLDLMRMPLAHAVVNWVFEFEVLTLKKSIRMREPSYAVVQAGVERCPSG